MSARRGCLKKALINLFFFFLIFFFIFPSIFLAATITTTSSPSSVAQLEEFDIGFSAQEIEADTDYYLKVRIGKEGTTPTKGETYNPSTSSWLSDSSAWTGFPTATSNGNGDLSATVRARAKTSAEEGVNQLFIRLRKVGSTTNLDSSPVELEITASVITPTPTPTPTTAPAEEKATYKINEVKDDDGNTLSSVKIYVDGTYLHHYAPETITFCNGCQCDTYVNCGFGSHTIKLEKSGYEDWSETKTLNSGHSHEVNPVMTAVSSSGDSTTTPTPIQTPTPKPTTQKTPAPKSSPGEILGEKTDTTSFFPWEATEEGEEEKEATSSKKGILPLVFLGSGLAVLGGAAYWAWYNLYHPSGKGFRLPKIPKFFRKKNEPENKIAD